MSEQVDVTGVRIYNRIQNTDNLLQCIYIVIFPKLETLIYYTNLLYQNIKTTLKRLI